MTDDNINWTPDMVAKAERRITELLTEATQERLIEEALRDHAEQHDRTAWNYEREANRLSELLEGRET